MCVEICCIWNVRSFLPKAIMGKCSFYFPLVQEGFYANLWLFWSLICMPTHSPPGKKCRQHMEDITGKLLNITVHVLQFLFLLFRSIFYLFFNFKQQNRETHLNRNKAILAVESSTITMSRKYANHCFYTKGVGREPALSYRFLGCGWVSYPNFPLSPNRV